MVVTLVLGLTAVFSFPLNGLPADPRRAAVASLPLVATLILATGAAFERLRPGFWRRPRAVALLVFLTLTCIVGARAVVPDHTVLAYVYPAAAVAMTLTVLVGMEMGLLAAVLVSSALLLTPGVGASVALLALIGSLAGSVPLTRVSRFQAFIHAAVVLLGALVVTTLALELVQQPLDMQGLIELVGAAATNAMLAVGLAVLGVLVAGSVFGVTTSLQLLDLARPDHPLLRKLQLQAPGTWQHSVLLGNLAESAAQSIGEDPLLLRVGAYYHDVGKLSHPELFVENQLGGPSPHDLLPPEESARLLISHVPDGAALAAAHRLPETIIDFIWQHHGTTHLAFFYRLAQERAGAEAVDDGPYRYPGPRPQTRAAALLMLADASEAAVRAARPTAEEEIRSALERVFQQRLESGQLDDSSLTLRDLRRIREAFVLSLRSLYHPRVAYPTESMTQAIEAVPGPGET